MECGLNILLVEDDLAQSELFTLLLKRTHPDVELTCFSSGNALLSSLDTLKDKTHPIVVLSDLNLQDMSGIELLERIHISPLGMRLRFVLFTQMLSPEVIQNAYSKGAAAILPKPNSLEEFESLLKAIVSFWSITIS